ncbi:MAG: hemerythrin domain-containing protein [Deltaproteobacteria bacterium]|nr:hemerythrin domain-containing protein [Deltaproteobacteria bacterium]MBI3388957.1 hemerythrin domain-containing protein [Deltaproteobacteria bacterium]
MNATMERLSRQHRDVLGRLAAIESASTDGGDFAEFSAYLAHEVTQHFALEERALFPVLARHLSLVQGPLAVMNAEHVAFGDLLRDLAAAVRGDDHNRQRANVAEIIHLLRDHIAKEDRILFPMAARLLSVTEQGEVDTRAARLAGAELAV